MALPQEYIDAMNEAGDGQEGEGFEALAEGYYLARLEKVSLTPKAGPSGYKQYVFVWKISAPRAAKNRTQWDRISLSPRSAFKMRELFEATGFTFDSDPEELVGEEAILELEQAEITSGKRKGEMGNDVAKVHPADADTRKLVGK